MTCHERGPADEIGGADGPGPEAQVRDGHRPRLLRVVDEVSLGVVVRLLADDLDRVLVGPDGAVGAQAVEDRAHRRLILGGEGRVPGEARLRHVVVDPDGEAGSGRGRRQLIEDRLHHGWRELLGSEPVPPADDAREGAATGRGTGEAGDHVEVERLAGAARLLGAIEHGHPVHGRRQGPDEVLDREGAVEPHLHHADLLAALARCSTVSSAVSAPDPMSTITRSASGAPV